MYILNKIYQSRHPNNQNQYKELLIDHDNEYYNMNEIDHHNNDHIKETLSNKQLFNNLLKPSIFIGSALFRVA